MIMFFENVKVDVMGFFVLSMGKFLSILNSAYSLHAILKNFEKKT
jgi:hypothetical protein